MLQHRFWTAALTLLALFPAIASAQEAPVSIEVYPADVNLKTLRDRQSFVVQVTYPSGLTRDVTMEATRTLSNPALVKLDGNTLHPVADGACEMKFDFGGLSKVVPVKVEEATVDRPISFKLDVMPIFLKSNCNTGSCHGAARGKDGFRLSLFGFDPDGDHFRLTREMPSTPLGSPACGRTRSSRRSRNAAISLGRWEGKRTPALPSVSATAARGSAKTGTWYRIASTSGTPKPS